MSRVSALIIDTNEDVLFLYKSLLESQDPKFDRFFVDNIEKAKYLIDLRKFDILAINYKLSTSDSETGVSIATKFRKNNPESPIVILTSLVREAKAEAKELDLTNRVLFIKKPILFWDLSEKLEDFLGTKPW